MVYFLSAYFDLGAIFNATYQELRQGKMESRRGDILSILTHRKQDKDKNNTCGGVIFYL